MRYTVTVTDDDGNTQTFDDIWSGAGVLIRALSHGQPDEVDFIPLYFGSKPHIATALIAFGQILPRDCVKYGLDKEIARIRNEGVTIIEDDTK